MYCVTLNNHTPFITDDIHDARIAIHIGAGVTKLSAIVTDYLYEMVAEPEA